MITMYGTTKHGEGWVMKLGSYEYVEDIVIQAGMFERDVELTFVEEFDEGMDDTTEEETVCPEITPVIVPAPYIPIIPTPWPTIPVPWTPDPFYQPITTGTMFSKDSEVK